MPSESVRLKKVVGNNILHRLKITRLNIGVLNTGRNLTPEFKALQAAHDLIESVHALVDGKEWDSESTSDLIDLLVGSGLEVRSPDEEEA